MSQSRLLEPVWPLTPRAKPAARAISGPPKPVTGPVLIGDTLSTLGGRPTLLRLWAEWARRSND